MLFHPSYVFSHHQHYLYILISAWFLCYKSHATITSHHINRPPPPVPTKLNPNRRKAIEVAFLNNKLIKSGLSDRIQICTSSRCNCDTQLKNETCSAIRSRVMNFLISFFFSYSLNTRAPDPLPLPPSLPPRGKGARASKARSSGKSGMGHPRSDCLKFQACW
jgi:hypothetical protein